MFPLIPISSLSLSSTPYQHSLSLSLTPYQHSTSTYIILTLTTAGLAWSSAAADCRKEGAQREQSNRERRREEVSLFWFHFSAWLDARTRSKEKVDSPVRWFWIFFQRGHGWWQPKAQRILIQTTTSIRSECSKCIVASYWSITSHEDTRLRGFFFFGYKLWSRGIWCERLSSLFLWDFLFYWWKRKNLVANGKESTIFFISFLLLGFIGGK